MAEATGVVVEAVGGAGVPSGGLVLGTGFQFRWGPEYEGSLNE